MRKNIVKSIISLALVSTCFLGACSNNKSVGGLNSTPITNTTDRDITFEDTASILTDKGASTGYTIVVPETTDYQFNFGIADMQELIESATGVAIPVIYDTGLSFDATAKRILVGQSKATEGCGIEFNYDELGEDGFKIKTVGNSVIIAGAMYPGSMFGIYDFLWYNLGIRCYAPSEVKIPDSTNKTVYLKDFDHTSVPDFAERTIGAGGYDDLSRYRWGLNLSHGENWYTWCHTYFQLLPPSQYETEHPEWYSKDGKQLCLSNDGMIEKLTEVMKERILNSSRNGGLFMLGHEDNSSFCDCTTCKKLADENGGESGVMMLFINRIADIMNPWMEENKPGDTVKWLTFAYGPTVEAPVVYKGNGKYEAYNDAVKPHENVGILIAPLGSDWGHNMADPEYNEKYYHMFGGWKALGAEFYVYTYNAVFDYMFVHMDNWSTVKDQYKLWVDMDCKFIFEEGAFENLPLYELSNYVHTRLMWDTDSDVEYYINDFIDNYYKAGAPYVKKYLNLIRTRYKLIERDMNERGESFRMLSFVRNAPEMISEEFWPQDWLISAIQLFDDALLACEKMENEEERSKAIKRIKGERLSPIFLLMELYKYELMNADVQRYIDDFREGAELNGITSMGQSGTVFAKLADWMSALEE